VSKADDIRQRVDALVAAGTPRTEAFKQLAAELSTKYNSLRGAYYTAAKGSAGSPSRTRRRETTADDALAAGNAAEAADLYAKILAQDSGDVAALAWKWKKPLTARLQPVAGKSAGDRTPFNSNRLEALS